MSDDKPGLLRRVYRRRPLTTVELLLVHVTILVCWAGEVAGFVGGT